MYILYLTEDRKNNFQITKMTALVKAVTFVRMEIAVYVMLREKMAT